jgi:hypothetical protein
LRHAVASNFLRVFEYFLAQEVGHLLSCLWCHTLLQPGFTRYHLYRAHFCNSVYVLQGIDSHFLVTAADCIVTMASDSSLGSVTFITDSCGAAGIVESLCARIAAGRHSDPAECTACLRCLHTLLLHHVNNQGRLCVCGGLAVLTQFLVSSNSGHQAPGSMQWAAAIVAHVASASRAGFAAAQSCGGVDAVLMSGVLCSAQSQANVAATIFDMVCSSPQVAALVRLQCNVDSKVHSTQPMSLLLQSSHSDIRQTALRIVKRLGKMEEHMHAQPKVQGGVGLQQPAKRWS